MKNFDRFLISAMSGLVMAVMLTIFGLGTANARPTGLLDALHAAHVATLAMNTPAYTNAFSQPATAHNPVAASRLAYTPTTRQRQANARYVVMKRDAGSSVSARSRAGPKRQR